MSMYDERIAKLKKQQNENSQSLKTSQAGSMYDERIAAIKASENPSAKANADIISLFSEKYREDQQKRTENAKRFQEERQEFKSRHGSNVDLMKFDLDAGQKEIDKLEAELARLRTEKNAKALDFSSRPYAAGQVTEDAQYTTGYGITNNRPYAAGLQAQQNIEVKDDPIRELEMQIAKKKQDFNQAKHYQETIAYDDTVKNADFDKYDDYAESDDTLYNWINNLQFRESYEASYQSIPNPNARRSKYTRKGYDQMNASEIAIYNYYYAKSGKEAAQKYLDTIQERLNERTAKNMYSTVKDDTAAEIVFGAAVGINQFITNVANNFRFKDDYIPQSAYQIAGKMADEGLADASIPLWYNFKEGKWEDKILGRSLGQIAYDAVTTGANMAPSILASYAVAAAAGTLGLSAKAAQTVGSYAGNTAMGLSAAGGAYQQALNEGYDKNQARGYSILVGASEMAMEKLLGGISAVGGNALGINAVKNIANADTAFKAIAKRIGGSALSEFGEEYLQEVLDPVFSNIMLKTDKEVKPISAEALYSGILGMLTGAIMESPSAIYGETQTAKTGRKLKEAGGVDSLAKIGNTFAADTVAYKLAGKVNENTGAYTIGQLLKEVDATLTEQNVNEISEALMKEGVGEIAAKKYAKAFAYVVEGGAMPDSMVNAIEADTVLAKAAREVLIDSNTTWNQRTQGYNEVLRKLAMDKVTGKTAPTSKASAPADNTAEAKTESGAEGNVEPAKYGNIQNIKNGKVTVKMTDGTEVDLKDADLDPEDSVRIETIASIDGISAEDASGIFGILKAGSKNSQYDAIGAREAYRYGYYGLTENHLNENGTFSKSLTPEQRKAVYEIGRKARDASVTAEIGKIKQMREAAAQKEPAKLRITYNQGNGVVQDIESKTITGLSRKQRAAVSFAKVLHQLGVGTDFEFFESYLSKTLKDKNGNRARVFLDDSGNEVIAYSGVYQTADGKIRIDLNAYSGRGLALNAMSHELVHFIKQWSPDRYRTMADIVGNAYGNTQMSMHQRVLREQARLERIRGTEVSYDEAYDEVVANALNRMLDDGTVLDRIAEIRKVDGGLADKMIDCIRKFIKRFAKVFSDNESLFYDTEDLMQFKDTVEELRGMFAEALVEASDNRLSSVETEAVESLGENATVETNEDGQLLLAKNESGNVLMYSEQTYQMGGRDKLKAALKQNGHTAEEINETLSFVDDALDYIKILAAGYAKNMGYTKLSNHLVADIVTNVKTGKQVMSSIVNNGDYPVNIDLSLICKKRVAYMNLMSRLIRDGIFDKVNYDGAAIAEVNGILRENGFETACLGCFVESRRLQFQAWAETIVSEWNSEVEKRNPNAKHFGFAKGKMEALTDADINALTAELESVKKNDQGNVNLGQGNSVTRMGRLLDALPSLQMKLTVEDLLTPEGLTALRKHDGSLFSIVKSRYGAASPKIVQDFNPYASEIAMLTFAQVKGITNNAVKGAQAYLTEVKREYGRPKKAKGESREDFNQRKKDHEQRVQDEAMRRYLYDIGGARIQSFSDFMIENVFDYIQIFADLSAKRLPLHGYSKEIVCLRLFGMTGAKWNGSLIAHVERSMGKEFAGLLPAGTKDGIPVNVDGKDYVIGFDDYARNVSTSGKSFIQSIGMKDIIALQLDPRYSPYVGNITIGVSDAQIMAMLDNPLFRMVIPYHASGMLPMFAKLVGVDMYNDYTDYQNTTIRQYYDVDGNAVSELKNAKGEAVKADTSFAFNAEIQKTKDAKIAADNYLRWCAQRHPVYDGKTLVGYATFNPKFSSSPYGNDFTRHENYYKLLEDFNTYDSLTEESAVQGAVTMNFPSEENRLTPSQMEAYKKSLRETGIFSEKDIEKYAKKADMTFKEIINAEVGNRANYEVTQAPKWESTVKAVEEKLQKDYAREQYSSQETDFDGDFDYSELNWATDLGIITGKDRAIFERTINNEILRGVKPQSANGEYIIDTGRCLMFTDGDFHRPTLSRVIVFETEYESLTDEAKRRILIDAESTGDVQESKRIIEDLYGPWFAIEYTQTVYGTNERENRGRKRANSKGSDRRYRAKSLKERLADEGISHLLADDEELYSTQETDNITARDLLSSTDVATIKNEVVKKKLSDYQKILEVKNAEDQKLREIRAEIKELSFAKAPKDTKKLKDLKFEAIKINNHISVYEGQLQRMEKELQSLVKRERAKVVKEAEKRDKTILAKEWMDAQVKQNETLREYRETRAALRQQESDTAVMEKEFIRITKEYEKLDAKRGKTISKLRTKLKNEAKKHRADEKIWMAEFGRLMREYEAADRSIDRLEQKIERQKAVAKERVENRNKTAMRHKIQNVVKELNSLLLTNDKKRRVPDNLKKAVADALDLVNMDTVDAENRAAKYADLIAKEQAKANPDQDKIDSYTMTMENILRQGEKMGQRIKELHVAYEEIQNSDDPDIANAYDPVIAGAIQELSATIGNTSIKNMSIEQLSDVYDVYRAVLTRVRDSNKAMAENIRASIEELAKSTIREVQTVGGSQKYRISALDAVRKFDWNNMKPVYAMERIGSSTLTDVFNNVRAGEDTWAKDVSEAREYYLEKSKKYGYDKWDFDKKYRFESNSGIPFELTLEQILSLYAYSKREQAADHLRLGGFVFDSNIETYKEKDGKKSLLKYKVNTADAHQITPEIMADIIGKLSKEQAGFVDEMQDYLSTVMGAKGNEVTSKMYGVKLFKEKFYFPLKSAKQFMFEQNEVSGEVRIKNSGFTNKVVAKANNPVILSNFMDVWSGHVNDMSMYHAFTLPLEDFNRVFNYNSPKKDGVESVSVKGTIQDAYSPAAVSYVKQLITDLNGGARTDSTTGVINKLTGMFKKGAVFASLSVVVQQPSAIARAAALVDTKYFFGPKVDQKRHKYLWAEVKKYAPVAIIKEMGYFDTNMGKSTQDFITGKEYSGIKEQAKAVVTDSAYRDELLSKAPALADEYAWCGIWAAVKRETKAKHPSMDTTSEAFLKLCGKRFTEVITKTQVYDSVLARSANMRSKDTGMKMATAFMAEPTTSINMIEDAIWKAKRGDKKYARKAIGAVIASQILNSILVSFVYAGRDDDEDETYAEKYISALTGSLVDGLNVATYIPFIKDIVSIMQGYDVERSDMTVVSDLWNAWKNLKNDKVSPYRKVENFAGSIAQIFGLPVKNIMRDVRGIYNTITNLAGAEQTTGSGVKYAISGAITGKTVSDKEQLYKARLDGDKQHAARVEARYDDEDSANAAVRAAIKDSFMADEIDEATALKHMVLYAGMDGSEAHWTMDAWKYRKKVGSDEGYGKYGKFHDAVRSGKNLESVIKEYTDNGVKASTLTGEITEEFKPVYLDASNSEKAAMKTKLISAYVACDMEREDAEKKLESWDFEAEYGFAYSDRKETYLSGKVSKATLVDILIDHGYDEEDAEAQVEAYEWEAAGFEDVTTSAIRNYNEWCEPVGIPKSVYLEFWRFDNSTENDVDKTTGKKIAYSAVKKIMAYINSLNLTDRQKDALAKSTGWADKTIKKYKLW